MPARSSVIGAGNTRSSHAHERVEAGVGTHAGGGSVEEAGRMRHFSIRTLSDSHAASRRRLRHCLLSPLALACRGRRRADSQAARSIRRRALKSSPVLEPPPPKALRLTRVRTDGADREPIFLRADRLEGENQQWIEAEGKVGAALAPPDGAGRLAALRHSRPTSSGPRAMSSCAAASTGSPVRRRNSSAATRPASSPRPSFTSARTRRAAMRRS